MSERLSRSQAAGAIDGAALQPLLWRGPFPATLQGADGRLVDVNPAYLAFTGFSREQVIGCDPIDLQPEEDQALHRALRDRLMPLVLGGESLAPLEHRLIDAQGRERWFRLAVSPISVGPGQVMVLALLQDTSAEHQARAQADRSIDELAQWFDLSPGGMLVFDASGLIVRSNPAFETLVGRVPVLLGDAAPDLQQLLGWAAAGPAAVLQPGAPVLESRSEVLCPDGRRRVLVARLRAFETEAGERRYMAVVDDRSAEDERDLAQLEVGALMQAAGIGVATFDAAHGWRRSPAPMAGPDAALPKAGAALQAISRDLVEPASRGEYEKLQKALRHGASAQVRYAVRHPELGLRWLLTRVAPAALGGGRATSVVTLDITEQQLAETRSDELLRELTTILEGSPAGIAYLRDGALVRCNRRFERLLGFAAGAIDGMPFESLFRHRPMALPAVQDAMAALASGRVFDTEFDATAPNGALVGYALLVRRAEGAHSGLEAVAVLTDITRLKQQQAELEMLLQERELMFSLSDVGIAWLRGNQIQRANQAMSTLTGFLPAELAGLPLTELHLSADAAAQFEDSVLRSVRSQGHFSGERQLRRRDGTLHWVQLAMRAVDAEDPRSDIVCSFVDIDERQRARESLQQQAGRTRSVLDSVLVGIVTVGDHGIEWMNRSARRMFAGELGDFAGEPIGTVATDEPGHPLRRSDWLERLGDGQAETFECRLRGRDGREFWVVGNAVATPREAASGRQVTFALLDIEARRQAEVRIGRARSSLQQVIETAPLAIALFDASTQQVQQLNQMAAAFFGQPLATLVGQAPADWSAWLGADEVAALRASLGLAADSPDGVRREITRSGADGQRLWDTRFVAQAQVEGSAAGQVLMVASDITALRVAEQARLDAAIAQREMLVKEVHHRIKNNLQGVAGLLQQTAARHPTMASVLGEAVGQVQTIAQVYGLQVGAGGPLELAQVIGAIAGSVQRSAARTIDVQASGPRWWLPEVESIPVALTVNELLTNAVKHSQGGVLSCRVLADDDGVTIEICNRGRLATDVDPQRVVAGTHGLGLVRALLPRRSASFVLEQYGDEVRARVTLRPPGVRREAGPLPAAAPAAPPNPLNPPNAAP